MANSDFPDLKHSDFDTLTAPEVEEYARWLIRQFNSTQKELEEIQTQFAQTESDLNLAMAKSRLQYGMQSRPDGKNYTETQKEDQALVDNEQLAGIYALDRAKVEILKGRVGFLKAQSDLVRSVMVSVRTSMETERGPN